MKNNFQFIVHNNGDVSKKDPSKAKEMFPIERARDAQRFHRQIPGCRMTPLVALPNLAQFLGVGGIYGKAVQHRRLHRVHLIKAAGAEGVGLAAEGIQNEALAV